MELYLLFKNWKINYIYNNNFKVFIIYPLRHFVHPPAFVLAVASYHYPSGQLHCVTRVAPAGPEILTPVQAMQSDLTAFTFALYVLKRK